MQFAGPFRKGLANRSCVGRFGGATAANAHPPTQPLSWALISLLVMNLAMHVFGYGGKSVIHAVWVVVQLYVDVGGTSLSSLRRYPENVCDNDF